MVLELDGVRQLRILGQLLPNLGNHVAVCIRECRTLPVETADDPAALGHHSLRDPGLLLPREIARRREDQVREMAAPVARRVGLFGRFLVSLGFAPV